MCTVEAMQPVYCIHILYKQATEEDIGWHHGERKSMKRNKGDRENFPRDYDGDLLQFSQSVIPSSGGLL